MFHYLVMGIPGLGYGEKCMVTAEGFGGLAAGCGTECLHATEGLSVSTHIPLSDSPTAAEQNLSATTQCEDSRPDVGLQQVAACF